MKCADIMFCGEYIVECLESSHNNRVFVYPIDKYPNDGR